MTSQNYWMLVVNNEKALDSVLDDGLMGFRAHVRETPGIDDPVVIYTTRGAFGKPDRDHSEVVASGLFTSNVEDSPVEIAGESYPRRIHLLIDRRLPLRGGVRFAPLVDEMEFIEHKRGWPGYVHRTLVSLTRADFGRLQDAINSAVGEE